MGEALVERGQGDEGMAQLYQGLAAYRATGAELALPLHLSPLAEGYGKTGRTEEGLRVVAEALAQVDKTGERVYEAELYRIKGELTLQSKAGLRKVLDKFKTGLGQIKGRSRASRNKSVVTDPRPLTPDPQVEAEACFLKAINIARKQSAKSWELRAATSLARLWQQQGKQQEAHKLLSEIYDWFTEGFARGEGTD